MTDFFSIVYAFILWLVFISPFPFVAVILAYGCLHLCGALCEWVCRRLFKREVNLDPDTLLEWIVGVGILLLVVLVAFGLIYRLVTGHWNEWVRLA